jgi:hypothetical protein
MVQELLEARLILPSIIPYSSPMVMVLNKEGTWCMCPDFHALDKLTIKDKFPIHVIDDLLNELQGSCVFTKLDLRSRLSPYLDEGGRYFEDFFQHS